MILASVPASEVLVNKVDIQYRRERWSQVSGRIELSAKIHSIVVASQVISSSVDTTSNTQRNAAIGEKVRLLGIDVFNAKLGLPRKNVSVFLLISLCVDSR